MSDERATYRDRVRALFVAHPGEWIDADVLEAIGGRYAWRTRVSECRRQDGMRIEWQGRTRRDGSTQSLYRYLPDTGLDSVPRVEVPVPEGALF